MRVLPVETLDDADRVIGDLDKQLKEAQKAQKVLDELKLHAVDWMGNTSGKLCVSLIEQLEVKVQK